MPEAPPLRPASARTVACAILASRVGPAAFETALPLSAFQRTGAARVQRILATHGLALLCDTVGLGKTYTALAVIETVAHAGGRVCLVIPASLKRMWRRALRVLPDAGRSVVLASHTALGLGRPPAGDFGLVVVDEAHGFRNPKTRRYRVLQQLCATADVLLITATPVNNSLSDLYFLLRLRCPDAALAELGVGSLRAALRTPEPRTAELERIRRALVVRRTRSDIHPEPGDAFRFPREVRLSAVPYRLPLPVSELAGRLEQLSFVGYQLSAARTFAPELLRLALLKRFDSSRYAIARTLERQVRFYEELVHALANGRTLSPRLFRSLYGTADDGVQLVLQEVALETATRHAAALQRDAERELSWLRAWLSSLPETDAKLDTLRGLLARRPASARTLVFTEYRDTARYLWRALRRRLPVGLIDGQGAWIGETPARRQDVVDRFAPLANGARVHPREAARVLIATDVLAEGMNLQDADAVVSYDLPWNPVKLIQRAGRIDRIGSEHERVEVYNFLPDREFDAFLGLAETLRAKIRTVRQAVGLEQPVFEPEEAIELFVPRELRPLQSSMAAGRWSDGIPCAAMSRSGRRVVVGLERGAYWELLVWDASADQVLSPADAETALAAAVDSSTAIEPDLDLVRTAIGRVLTAVAARAAAAPRDRAHATFTVAAERVRQAVSELPFESADLYTEADAILARLAGVNAPDVASAVAAVLAQKHGSAIAFFRRLRRALEPKRTPAAQPEWRVTGVLVID